MKRTGKQSRGRAAEVQRDKPRSPGWHTTDEEEIERRRLRGVEEAIRIEALEPEQVHYGSFLTRSGSGAAYAVEIRSLDQRLNSCDCPDYRVNRLGTCKHIEAVLFANVVINVDIPWNPARLEQRIARAWHKHQTRSVQVINLVCENSIEHRMLHMLEQKQTLADGVLDSG